MLKPAKAAVVAELDRMLRTRKKPLFVLDAGCGVPHYIVPLLKKYPDKLGYIGMEPHAPSKRKAQELLVPYNNAILIDNTSQVWCGEVDVVMSLSVLEHVRDVAFFVWDHARHAKPGAKVIMLYDLGHSLRPSSLRERLQCWWCASPARRAITPPFWIARYVAHDEVLAAYKAVGIRVDHVTMHAIKTNLQLNQHRAEYERELPSITVWGRKND